MLAMDGHGNPKHPDSHTRCYSSQFLTGWNPLTSPLNDAVEEEADSGDRQGERTTADRVPCTILTIYSTAG